VSRNAHLFLCPGRTGDLETEVQEKLFGKVAQQLEPEVFRVRIREKN
jgi:hypothetical protein